MVREVFVLNLLTLDTFFTEVDESGVLFCASDCLGELAACVDCFRGEVGSIVVSRY